MTGRFGRTMTVSITEKDMAFMDMLASELYASRSYAIRWLIRHEMERRTPCEGWGPDIAGSAPQASLSFDQQLDGRQDESCE